MHQHTVFSSLPKPLAAALALGSVGKSHLLQLAKAALVDSGLELLGRELAQATWEADLLDGELAEQLEPLVPPQSDPRMLQCLRDVCSNWRRPENLEYYQRLRQKKDMDKAFAFLYSQHEKEPHNLFWLQQALGMAAYDGAFDWLAKWLGKGAYPQALEDKVGGDLAFFQGDYALAAQHYKSAWDSARLYPALVRRAECLYRLGEVSASVALNQAALEARPWNTNLLLTSYDRTAGQAAATSVLPGRVAVLLYTFNKADDLQRTLDALMPQLPDYASVFVLDNGSEDGTAELLDSWNQRFSDQGSDTRFSSIRLPVNIGAPAARNWLVAMKETRAYDWLVFLDDDALPPNGWLEQLGQAAAACPEAAVWGCKVVDANNPLLIQSADTHLTDPPPPQADGFLPAYQRAFGLSKLHLQDLDFGQFDYLRPCVSVTGCCHLFRRETLEQSEGFDLRFTPSQYDDVEHDLRLALQGRQIVYQGHLRVKHCKRTGSQSRQDPQELARALGNMYRLQMKYEPEQIVELRQQSAEVLGSDLLTKADKLRTNGMDLPFWT